MIDSTDILSHDSSEPSRVIYTNHNTSYYVLLHLVYLIQNGMCIAYQDKELEAKLKDLIKYIDSKAYGNIPGLDITDEYMIVEYATPGY